MRAVLLTLAFTASAFALGAPQAHASYGPYGTKLGGTVYQTSQYYAIDTGPHTSTFYSGGDCATTFSPLSGTYYTQTARPDGSLMSGIGGTQTNVKITASWFCDVVNAYDSQYFRGWDGIYQGLFFDSTQTGGQTGHFYFNVYAGTNASSTPLAYYDLVWNGTTLTVNGTYTPPGPTTSGITSVTTPTATTYIGNPITFAGTYDNINTFTRLEFQLSNTTNGFQLLPFYIPATIGTNQTFSLTRTLPLQGNYIGKVRLYDIVNATSTPWINMSDFGLATTTETATSTKLWNRPTPLSCDTLDIGCYMSSALSWAFYPTIESINQFQTITLQNTFPFSYAYDMGNVQNELLGNTSTTTPTISIPFGGGTLTLLSASLLTTTITNYPFINTLKVMIGWLLWIMFAQQVYYLILRAHNKETK